MPELLIPLTSFPFTATTVLKRRSRRWTLISIVVATFAIVVGASSHDAAPPTEVDSRFTASPADLAYCVSEVNRYRALVGAPPLSRSDLAEKSAVEAARADHRGGRAHQHFRRAKRDYAEVEALRWPRRIASEARPFTVRALGQMWAEGPGGGHYEIMRSMRYTSTGCGFYGDGKIATFVQHFR